MRSPGSREDLEIRRRRAIQLLDGGATVNEVAQVLGVDPRSVRRWWKAARQHGVDGLRAKPVPGRPPFKLSDQQLLKLNDLLEKSDRAQSAFKGNNMNWIDMCIGLIKEQFEMRCSAKNASKLLHALGWEYTTVGYHRCTGAQKHKRPVKGWSKVRVDIANH